jgi:hypothetical protein
MSFAAQAVEAPSQKSSGDASTTLTRNVLVSITGSPATFDSLGAQAGTWSLQPQTAAQIFGRDASQPLDDTLKQLRRAIPKKVTVLQVRSSYPDVCAFHIDGLPGNEFTHTGEDAHLFLLGPGETNTPQDIYVASGDTELGAQWMQQFPEYTKDNVRTHQVMKLNGADYYFVHQDHPVTSLLYNNQESLGTKISPEDRVNGSWYRVNNQVFEDSCHTLNSEIFNKTPQTYDLSKFSVSLKRPGNKRWLDTPLQLQGVTSSEYGREEKQAAYKAYADSPLYVVARLQVEYSLPPVNNAAVAGATPAMPLS